MMTKAVWMVSLGLAAGVAMLPAPALADALVVRSTGSATQTYPVGRRLPATARVELREGDTVVLVGEGPTRTLRGPGSHPVRATTTTAPNRAATLGRFLSASGATISRTGAVRGAGDNAPAAAPNLWLLNVAASGRFCVADLGNVTMWRPDMTQDSAITLTRADNGDASATLAFVAGQNFRLWPSEAMPIAEGVTYRIAAPGTTQAQEIDFVAIGTPPTDAEAIAALLAEKGCMSQLAQLGSRLEDAEITP